MYNSKTLTFLQFGQDCRSLCACSGSQTSGLAGAQVLRSLDRSLNIEETSARKGFFYARKPLSRFYSHKLYRIILAPELCRDLSHLLITA